LAPPRWLKPGFKKSHSITVGSIKIKILPVSIFLATKWEAYKSRGGDPRTSHDFEDIITVIDNNLKLLEDVANADKEVQAFLDEIIECHINPFKAEERKNLIVDKLKQIIKIAAKD
jgi:hypothetical protein